MVSRKKESGPVCGVLFGYDFARWIRLERKGTVSGSVGGILSSLQHVLRSTSAYVR